MVLFLSDNDLEEILFNKQTNEHNGIYKFGRKRKTLKVKKIERNILAAIAHTFHVYVKAINANAYY
jgi:hypothetical protein